jgi:alcohol oxidase
LETIAVPEVSSLDQSVHGTTGPIEISYGTHCPKGPQDDILAAAKSYGYPEIHDLQDFTSVGGFNRSAKYIGRDGTRQDAAHRYIHPLIADGKHPNLHILPESKVRRVLFEGSRAVGVEYEPEPMFLLQDISLITRISKTVKAKKLIVVSAGALGTPLILERSGIGNKELLAKHNIPLISDLPSVGENYQDHHFLLCPYKTNLSPDETLDGIMTRRRDFMEALTSKDTILGTNALDIGAKLRMTAEEVDALGPEFKAIWDRDFKDDSTKPIMLMGTLNFFVGDHKMLNEEKNGVHQYITMASYTPYPYSRGSIHITSPDCNVPPKFITGYLGDTNGIDLKKSVWAYKKARDIYRRTNAFAGEVALGHPVFRDGSPAALSIGPIKKAEFHSVEERKDIPPVEYDEEDNRAIEKFIRDKISTTWHSLGTCKMAPRDRGGVVDKDLNVYGLTGLKCAGKSRLNHSIPAATANQIQICQLYQRM